ncbi:hypothetical protein JCM17844_12810 [Iodidimonas gelatinilytica]|uniref:Uncharacterized protein n=1 Tax=Iodidimonas gelatinilytica TaxID=1236966 RepID=A0A5A7MPS0_9PROT|nr:hypothetical protein JCM17844_12810 [Iodidimonas gelatinilytica]
MRNKTIMSHSDRLHQTSDAVSHDPLNGTSGGIRTDLPLSILPDRLDENEQHSILEEKIGMAAKGLRWGSLIHVVLALILYGVFFQSNPIENFSYWALGLAATA